MIEHLNSEKIGFTGILSHICVGEGGIPKMGMNHPRHKISSPKARRPNLQILLNPEPCSSSLLEPL